MHGIQPAGCSLFTRCHCYDATLNTAAAGFLFKAHVLDFAGGNVVEVSCGVSGLVSAVMLGHRKGYGKEAFEPYNILLTTVGAAMIWVGWFGFNGGSALSAGKLTLHRLSVSRAAQKLFNSDLSMDAAGGSAGNAVLVSQIAGGVAAITWTVVETFHTGSPKVVSAAAVDHPDDVGHR